MRKNNATNPTFPIRTNLSTPPTTKKLAPLATTMITKFGFQFVALWVNDYDTCMSSYHKPYLAWGLIVVKKLT